MEWSRVIALEYNLATHMCILTHSWNQIQGTILLELLTLSLVASVWATFSSMFCVCEIACFLEIIILVTASDDPSIIPGVFEVEGTIGQSLILTCGTKVNGNPRPAITWLNPHGSNVENSSSFRHFDDEMGVRLNLSCVSFADIGNWTCVLSAPMVDLPVRQKRIGIYLYVQRGKKGRLYAMIM